MMPVQLQYINRDVLMQPNALVRAIGQTQGTQIRCVPLVMLPLQAALQARTPPAGLEGLKDHSGWWAVAVTQTMLYQDLRTNHL